MAGALMALLAASVVLVAPPAHGDTFTPSDTSELRAAVTAANTNGEDEGHGDDAVRKDGPTGPGGGVQ